MARLTGPLALPLCAVANLGRTIVAPRRAFSSRSTPIPAVLRFPILPRNAVSGMGGRRLVDGSRSSPLVLSSPTWRLSSTSSTPNEGRDAPAPPNTTNSTENVHRELPMNDRVVTSSLLFAVGLAGLAAFIYTLTTSMESDAQSQPVADSTEESPENPNTQTPSGAVEVPIDPEMNEDEIKQAAIDKLSFDSAGWEKMYDDKSFKAWKHLEPGKTMYRYRVDGIIDAAPEVFFELYKDLRHWKSWDENVDHIDVLGTDKSGKVTNVYWSVKYPYPFSYRDYVFKRYSKFYPDKQVWLIYCKATEQLDVPVKSKIVRVTQYQTTVCLQRTPEGTTRIIVDSIDDPKMTLPNWLFNWLTGHGMKKFLENLERQAKKYVPPEPAPKPLPSPVVAPVSVPPKAASAPAPAPVSIPSPAVAATAASSAPLPGASAVAAPLSAPSKVSPAPEALTVPSAAVPVVPSPVTSPESSKETEMKLVEVTAAAPVAPAPVAAARAAN